MNMNNTNTAGSNNNSAGTNKQPNKQTVKPRKLPIRQCAGCGEHFPKKQMIRVLRTPDGEIVLDDTGKKSGRGAYLCKNVACFKRARKTHKLERELSCEISEEIYDAIEKKLADIS